MMLRASIEGTGDLSDTDIEAGLRAITDGGAASPLPHGDVLTAFAEALVRRQPKLADVRARLATAIGPAAVIDAAGIVGNFQRMTRIADATGIPLDGFLARHSVDLRRALGIDRFATGADDPPTA